MLNFTKSTLLANGKIRHFVGMFLKNIEILSYYYPSNMQNWDICMFL